MNWRYLAIVLPGLLALTAPAAAHRLDQYLQATTITVAADRIALDLRLTPGVGVAGPILAELDADGNGVISTAEEDAEATRVIDALSATVDDQTAPLALVASTYPLVQDLRAGTGNIVLSLTVPMPAGNGPHSFDFENRYRGDISVYLVNTLIPADASIGITGQQRNQNQSSYRLDFTVGAVAGVQAPAVTQQALAGEAQSATAVEFFWQGVHHILTGYDHLLFVAALVLGAASLWDLVKIATAFTVAHSLTLTLAVLQLVHLPGSIVEPLIAASIVVVALQNIFWPDRARGWSRLIVAFIFGLFHGLGFAGGLLELMNQLPRQTILIAILAFSVGIELGNQLVIVPTYAMLAALRRSSHQTQQPRRLQQAGSTLISLAGTYFLWTALTG